MEIVIFQLAGLGKKLDLIINRLEQVMESQADLVTQLNTVKEQLAAQGVVLDNIVTDENGLMASIAALQEVIKNQPVSDEVQAAMAAVTAASQGMADRLAAIAAAVPDAPPAPPPAEAPAPPPADNPA